MASTTGPDLEPGRLAVEALMDDACTIERPSGAAKVLDEATGVLVTAAATVVYNASSVGSYDGRSLADSAGLGGRCVVSHPGDTQPGFRSEGGRAISAEVIAGKIPVDAPRIREGDVLRVLSSRRDPWLVGEVYRVARVIESTYAISRKLVLEIP